MDGKLYAVGGRGDQDECLGVALIYTLNTRSREKRNTGMVTEVLAAFCENIFYPPAIDHHRVNEIDGGGSWVHLALFPHHEVPQELN